MSVAFSPPPGLNEGHLGAFWAAHRNKMPHVVATSPIAASNEVFGPATQWLPPALQVALSNQPQCRLQMSSDDGQWMCQLQRDRIVSNWRHKKPEIYPRFGTAFSRFKELCGLWKEFLVRVNLEPPSPAMWELTYVNRIKKGTLWNDPQDWPNILPGLWRGEFIAAEGLTMRGLQGQWVWDLSSLPARLYVESRPSTTSEKPPEETLMLNLTARGPIRANGATDWEGIISPYLNKGHELIVLTFDAITSDAAKQHWRRHGAS